MRHPWCIKGPADAPVAIKQDTATDSFATISEAMNRFGGGVLGMTVITEVIYGSFGQQNTHNGLPPTGGRTAAKFIHGIQATAE
jgi:hypothetical protein